MISTNATPISINFVFLMMIFFGTVFLSVNIVERYAIDRIQTKGRIEYRLTFALFYRWCWVILFNSSSANLLNLKYIRNFGNIDNIGNIPVRTIFSAYHSTRSHL